MTIEELYNLYGTKYKFRKETGLSITTFDNWLKLGYIPIASQMKLEKLTKGLLKARFEDVPK